VLNPVPFVCNESQACGIGVVGVAYLDQLDRLAKSFFALARLNSA
jgi:hypothetical protein